MFCGFFEQWHTYNWRVNYLISRYSSGLIKIWSISEGNEIQSLEGHAEKVWTLSINENDDIVSGDSEGCITVWTVFIILIEYN